MSYINNKYKLLEQIGKGSFGSIFKGLNIRTNEFVAIKVESISNNTKLLKNESIIYQYLSNTNLGIPIVKWFGKDETNYYMVINLLGKSLQTILDKKDHFSIKTVLQIAIKILYLLKTIHDKGLVHRDIKPDNFLLGTDTKNKQIYIIDFGFCKSIMNNNEHIEIKENIGFVGSLTYASINAHKSRELSRRDDLESLGYMLLYFLFGKLEWQKGIHTPDKIKEMKENIIYVNSIPEIFKNYLKYVRDLKFKQPPNYEFLINMFVTEIKLIMKQI